MNPALLKLIGVALVLAAVFFGGWTVNGWRWDAKYTDRENTLQKQYSDEVTEYEKKLQDQEKVDRTAALMLESKAAVLNQQIDRLKEQAKHVHFESRTAPVSSDSGGVVSDCSHPFTTELPRAINRLSDAAERPNVSADAAAAPGIPGITETPIPTSAVDGGAIVDWYAEVARLYGQCKAQLDAIRDWDAKP